MTSLTISNHRFVRRLLGAALPALLLSGATADALAQGAAPVTSAAPPAPSAAPSPAPVSATPPPSPTGSAPAPLPVSPPAARRSPAVAAPARAVAPPPAEPPPQDADGPPSAEAAPLIFSAAGGSIILSADRLFGVSSYSSTSAVDSGNVHIEAETSGTMVNLLWGNSAISGGGSNPFATPRLSFDAFVGPNVTLGGSIGYVSTSGSSKTPDFSKPISASGAVQYKSQDSPTSTAFILEPRIGVAIPIGERAGLWLRGGITYFHGTTEVTDTEVVSNPNGADFSASITTTLTSNATDLTLDPVLVFLPVPHVGLTIGPIIDVGLGGSSEVTTSGGAASTSPAAPTSDDKLSNYGAAAGMLVFF